MTEPRKKVVITGIGPVTPVGIGLDDFWTGMTSGRNGVRTITRFPIDDLPVTLAGEVDGFDPADFLEPKEARRTDRFTQFGVAAAKLAWEDAGEPDVVSERGGVIFATGIGGIETLLTQYDVLLNKGPGPRLAVHGSHAHGERSRGTHRHEVRPDRRELRHDLGVLVQQPRHLRGDAVAA